MLGVNPDRDKSLSERGFLVFRKEFYRYTFVWVPTPSDLKAFLK